ncbi:uncharacterized protein LOC130730704 isoform X2 [Lotus japonicus]|uniref:uncharacterized protein LOC130730704 isoform X2 n=1 Tax=Lotus japonicus TaxID=34305 RepID=UPI00258BCC65|nr:uncharacterized protein LOC130730704 isoform X2 [Lotus japonicus]
MASAQKNQSSVSHFSHPHPLEHTTAPSTTSNPTTCSGCKLRVTTNDNDYYRCSKTKTCNFSLHSVCYNMPFITNHPSHPTHDLLLFLAPPSLPSLNTCFACKNHATGLTYHCAECTIFFHPLCLLLPLSLAIKHHPHKIKLEFLPPYDFYCDFCNKPSFSGWLYRCSMCEFDIHIACAVDNLEHHMDNYKIMRLVAEQVGGGISRTQFDNGITGAWDKKFYNQRKNRNMSSGNIMKVVELELQETEQSSVFQETEESPVFALANFEEKTPLRDKLVPLSDFASPPTPSQSNQFGESYFSIDLTKSYSNSTYDHRSQVPKEGTEFVVPESIVERAEESYDVVKWSSNSSCNSHQHLNKLHEAFFKGGLVSDYGESRHMEVMKNSKESLAKWSHEDHIITKPEKDAAVHVGGSS